MARKLIFQFLRTEAASASVLALAAALALIAANSPLAPAYRGLIETPINLAGITHSLLDWVKEGPMALFFFLVGLEIKREIVGGELSDPRAALLPILAAIGGMIAPALVYLAAGGPHQGWPVPVATDIAFALAAFGLFGRGLPSSLRVFLLALAIVDDLGAVVLIALLFSGGFNVALLAAMAGVLALMGFAGRWKPPAVLYLLGLLIVWGLSLKSGLSPTVAGAAAALTVPVARIGALEHGLHGLVAFLVLPLFAFLAAGASLAGFGPAALAQPATLSVMLGLSLGKAIGVAGGALLAVKLKLAKAPAGAGGLEFLGVALLCGIGFTMSLFLSELAFDGQPLLAEEARLGVLIGSVISAALGGVVLWIAARRRV